MKHTARRLLLGALIALASTGTAAVVADRLVALRGLDRERIALSLYTQQAYTPVHEVSEDPVLHYELRAGARMVGTGKYGPYQISINQHRARGPAHPVEKAPGVFRILCFGPSSTFGADVDDAEAIPARLEAWLSERSGPEGPDIEVWNFGTSAYVPIQSAHLARKKLGALDPDMVLMIFNNGGRRAFLPPEQGPWDPMPWFQADPLLWEENLPSPDPRLRDLHPHLLRASAFYRYAIAWLVLDRRITLHPDQTRPLVHATTTALMAQADQAGVDLVVVSWHQENQGNFPGLAAADHIPVFPTARNVFDAHPPPSVLDQIAARIGSSLVAAGRIPGLSAEGVVPLTVEVDDRTMSGQSFAPRERGVD